MSAVTSYYTRKYSPDEGGKWAIYRNDKGNISHQDVGGRPIPNLLGIFMGIVSFFCAGYYQVAICVLPTNVSDTIQTKIHCFWVKRTAFQHYVSHIQVATDKKRNRGIYFVLDLTPPAPANPVGAPVPAA